MRGGHVLLLEMGQLRVPSEVSECLADGDNRLIVCRWRGSRFPWVGNLGWIPSES
jgi:hypothetical protein